MRAKRTILFRIGAILLLLIIAGIMMVIGRGHTVYIDNKSIDYNGQTYTTPYKVVVYVDGEQVAKLRDKERGMATCIGQTFKMTLEITQEKGGSEEMVDVPSTCLRIWPGFLRKHTCPSSRLRRRWLKRRANLHPMKFRLTEFRRRGYLQIYN